MNIYVMTSNRRVNVKAILADPVKRKALMVDALIATQAREGIVTTKAQAEAAYDKVQDEIRLREGLLRW